MTPITYHEGTNITSRAQRTDTDIYVNGGLLNKVCFTLLI